MNKIFHNSFLKNVFTLASGTIISQAVVILTSPLLTRLYKVEDFGNLSVFSAVSSFLILLTTGRYELAVGLPHQNSEAKTLLRLILKLSAAICIFYLAAIFYLKYIRYDDPSHFLVSYTSYLTPFYAFFIALNSASLYWLLREKQYKKITIANSLQVIISTFSSVIFGFLGFREGMIFALLIGAVASFLYIFVVNQHVRSIFRPTQNSVIEIGKKYISFPKYMTFTDLSTTANQQLIPIIFSVLYSTSVVGLFSLAFRMLRLPNIVITSSVTNVFRNDAIDEIRKNGNCSSLYRATIKKLFFVSFPIYALLFIFSPLLFKFVFGEAWLEAGYYARIISTMLFIEFVALPLNALFYLREKQKIFMWLQFLNAIFGALMIFLGYKMFNNPYYSLILFSVNSFVFSLLFIFLTYRISKENI